MTVRYGSNTFVETNFNVKPRDELLNCETFITLTEAKVLIVGWKEEYNHFGPHSAKGYKPPTPERRCQWY